MDVVALLPHDHDALVTKRLDRLHVVVGPKDEGSVKIRFAFDLATRDETGQHDQLLRRAFLSHLRHDIRLRDVTVRRSPHERYEMLVGVLKDDAVDPFGLHQGSPFGDVCESSCAFVAGAGEEVPEPREEEAAEETVAVRAGATKVGVGAVEDIQLGAEDVVVGVLGLEGQKRLDVAHEVHLGGLRQSTRVGGTKTKTWVGAPKKEVPWTD